MTDGTWVALPTYNERDNLGPMVKQLLHVLPAARILVVDDNSPDGTGTLADAIASREPRVAVLHRAGKEGLGAAYRAAFRYLRARRDCGVAIQMDCDFSHDPADTTRLLSALENADLVIGSRYVPGGGTPGWSLGRRWLSRGGSAFARLLLRLPPHDLTGGFKAWRAHLLRTINLDQVGANGYGFQIEMTWRAHRSGARIHELPITFSERRAGSSKMTRRIIGEALLMVVRLRLDRGGRHVAESADLPVGDAVGVGLVGGAGGVAVDDLGAVAVAGSDRPAGGRLSAHHAGNPDARP